MAAGALLLLQLRMRRAGGDAVFCRRALPALLEAAAEGTGSSSTHNPPLPSPAVNAQPPITSLVNRGREEVAAADEGAPAQNSELSRTGQKMRTNVAVNFQPIPAHLLFTLCILILCQTGYVKRVECKNTHADILRFIQ
jgi:hypothetical protein